MNVLVHLRAGVLQCPTCRCGNLHQGAVEVFQRAAEDSSAGGTWGHIKAGLDVILPMDKNPSPRRDGLRIHFSCEICSLQATPEGQSKIVEVGPVLTIIQHKGETIVEWEPEP